MIKMFEKESTYENENIDPNDIDENENEDEYEYEEDTLSFYELSINSNADAWEESSSRESSQNSSFKSSEEKEEEDNYFEFFSEELIMTHQPDNIIFCGKIIPHKQQQQQQPISIFESPKNVVIQEKKHRNRSIFKWKSIFASSFKSRTFSRNKMSILSSMTKSRWYVYLFGITRFRSEMEIRDMKNRQYQGSPSFSLPRLESSEYYTECNSGAWRLLRVLSCTGGDQVDTVVEHDLPAK